MTKMAISGGGPGAPTTTDASGAPAGAVVLPELISGEDETNNVLMVENQYGYEFWDHGAASADEILGTTGAIGDLLHSVLVLETPNAQTIDVYDGTVAAGQLVLSIPTAAAAGAIWYMDIVSANGGFTLDDKADDQGQVLCVGRFT